MMINPYEVKEQIVYQADPTWVQSIRAMKEKLHSIGSQYIGRYVRIQTIDGQQFEGTVVQVDRGLLYLNVNQNFGYQRPYNPAILPLVLYELLVITLLYT